ncbi:uncharacterized protein K489DRAFT_378776 [Dissoconium aciculare CBS 342.82]|uniref:Uncharacterized protein n=1 Tax=Dissoconium aciculare CBS 342.82 TaxID=1314786 RepID=A0A6J3M8I2_9PEZI|nr:uncharacterized protein K489DRAFT_378776 [Dissoconium aciculare CBS 342.82]KAF1824366.1 hypothetical protein K489DRAFT_378776 [Dissoconium aciculare CBS 342.82]
MAKLPIYLVTYDRGTYDLTGQTRPYHWSYFIQLPGSSTGQQRPGIAHQLRGMPGSFHYPGPEALDLSKTLPAPNQELEIGEIDADELDRVHEILAMVSIDLGESTKWNCQNWSLEGLERMKRVEGGGIGVYSHLDAKIVRDWLKER